MSTTTAQPNLLQYPISDLYLFPDYTDRAAYLAATGRQAPPYNDALPIKPWADPSPSGQPYLMFDSTAAPGYSVEVAVPAPVAGAVNLPGAYSYPAYVEVPTDAQGMGPYGSLGLVSPGTVCLRADAQTLANEFTALYGKTVTVVDNTAKGIYYVVYGADPRRQWGLQVAGGPMFTYAQTFIEAASEWGVGYPFHWALESNNGTPPTMLPTPVQDPPVTTAPANVVTLPVPIRPLLPNEQFKLVPPSNPLFGTAAWMVVRTDMQPAITLAEVQQLVEQYNAQPGVTAIAIG